MSMSKNIGKRFTTLSFVQLLNLLFPIFLYFILLERIGISEIGEIMSWQMVFAIIASLSNYSFPTRLIPKVEKLNSTYILSVYWNKLLQIRFFFVLCLSLVMLFGIFFLPKIAILTSFIFYGRMFSPAILLPLLSKNKTLLFYNFLFRLVSLVLVFFIISKSNYFWTNFIIGGSELVVSLIVIKHLGWNFGFKIIKFSEILRLLKADVKLFLIQFTNALIVMITIPLTHLFFGAQTAGIISIIDKMVMVVRNTTGSLFYSIIPETLDAKNMLSVIKGTIPKFKVFTIIIVIAAIIGIVVSRDYLDVKFTSNKIFYYLILATFSFLPIIMSTPYQIIKFRLKRFKSIFFIARVQLLILIFGLVLFGNLFGIYGIVCSILLHESVSYLIYRKGFDTF